MFNETKAMICWIVVTICATILIYKVMEVCEASYKESCKINQMLISSGHADVVEKRILIKQGGV